MSDHYNLQCAYDYIPQPVLAIDDKGIIVYANKKAGKDYFGTNSYNGQPISNLFQRIVNLEITAGEYKLKPAQGEQQNVLLNTMVYRGTSGITLTYLFLTEITALKKKENLLAFLNIATSELSRARDTISALDKIAKLIVPKFATWFSIDLAEEGKLVELVLAHEDPQMIAWARKYRELYPASPNDQSGTARVLRTGIPNCIPVITREMIVDSIRQPEQLELVTKLNLQSVITVAVYIREVIAGIINFVSSTPGIHYDETDVQFAQNFANHVGMALENAKLNEDAGSEIMRRKKAETKLQLAQSHLQSALSSGLVGTWVRDLEKSLLYADESLSAMFGLTYTPEGCDPQLYQQLIAVEDQAIVLKKRQHAISSTQNYEIEYQVRTPSGPKWFFARGKTEINESGKPLLFTGVMIDITQRKKAELLQKENEKIFRFLADAVPHKIWTSGPDGKANYYNKGWYDYSGVNSLDELKSIVWDMLHPEDRAIAATDFPKIIESGGEMETEQRLRHYDGQYR